MYIALAKKTPVKSYVFRASDRVPVLLFLEPSQDPVDGQAELRPPLPGLKDLALQAGVAEAEAGEDPHLKMIMIKMIIIRMMILTILAATSPGLSPSSAVVRGQKTPSVKRRRRSAREFRLGEVRGRTGTRTTRMRTKRTRTTRMKRKRTRTSDDD